ncbi:GNAT family N-acetyltransferase [Arenimonas composti]|uniref:BioF2-like acetyltransferase domain-containing protein n=1 Tax=Arenimonas composti TR7-09 = DSM 18010 TaxID=1121013 RepID=A0A091BX15_9GAMM|nr:GNAT family N-acetyltransferase [Arenimonas composti]KFN48875.1 hypothetical protein P873_13055 [Arenimonas composti TR7-09 = DSM 18010]
MTPAARKARYREFCATETRIPLFSRPWWLDAVAGADGWQVSLVEKGGQVLATMPYVYRKRAGFRLVKHAPLTSWLGPWFAETGGKPATRLGNEHELIAELYAQLLPYDYLQQQWGPHAGNWLPLHWAGFRQTTRYTYVLPSLADRDALWAGLQENVRREVRKAQSRAGLVIDPAPTIDEMIRLATLTYARQGRPLPYSGDFLRRLDAACVANDARSIVIARDGEGRAHAGVYIVRDDHCAYYLVGGGDPELRKSGATSLCMWSAIVEASEKVQRFDFEGSMVAPIERFFRGFGAVQTPYFRVSRMPSMLMRLRQALLVLRGKD